MEQKKSIVLIDLSSLFWRYWHVSENDEVSTARRKTVNTVMDIAKDHDYCAVCVDSPPFFIPKVYFTQDD